MKANSISHSDISVAESCIRSRLDRPRNRLHIEYCGNITPEIMSDHLLSIGGLLPELSDGFTVVTDLSGLDGMDDRCLPGLRSVMETYAQGGLGTVIRYVPDATKDIGFNILSMFHYPESVRIVTCADEEELARELDAQA